MVDVKGVRRESEVECGISGLIPAVAGEVVGRCGVCLGAADDADGG